MSLIPAFYKVGETKGWRFMNVKRRVLVLVMAIVLVLAVFSACGNTTSGSSSHDNAQGTAGVTQDVKATDAPDQGAASPAQAQTSGQDTGEEEPPESLGAQETNADAATGAAVVNGGLLNCDGIFTYGDLQYHILRVRDETTGDGERFLLVKMEVFNNGSNDVNFSSLLSFELTDKSGKVTYAPSPFAKTEGNLDGTLLSSGRLVGEVALELGDSTEKSFVMNIAQNFEFRPAWLITEKDLGESFAEVFEPDMPKSDYTVGIPLERGVLTVLMKNVGLEESGKEGLSLLLCEMELRNNSADWLPFMLGMDYDVYSVKGNNLDMAAGRFDFPSEVEGNATVSGIASFYCEAGTTDFYMTVSSTAGGQQMVGDMMHNDIITFSIGAVDTDVEVTGADVTGLGVSDSDASQDDQQPIAEADKSESGQPDLALLVPDYPLDLLPIFPEAAIVDSVYDYRGGTGQESKYKVTAELSVPAAGYDDVVAFYSGYGFGKETSTTNEGATEETRLTGSLDKYTVEITILKFLHTDRDTICEIVLTY